MRVEEWLKTTIFAILLSLLYSLMVAGNLKTHLEGFWGSTKCRTVLNAFLFLRNNYLKAAFLLKDVRKTNDRCTSMDEMH